MLGLELTILASIAKTSILKWLRPIVYDLYKVGKYVNYTTPHGLKCFCITFVSALH